MKMIYNHTNYNSDPNLIRYSKMADEDAELFYKNRKSKLHQELLCFRKRRSSSIKKNTKGHLEILDGKLKKMSMGKFIIYNVKFNKRKGKYIGRKIKTTQNLDFNKSITQKKRRNKRKFSTMNYSKKYRTCKKK